MDSTCLLLQVCCLLVSLGQVSSLGHAQFTWGSKPGVNNVAWPGVRGPKPHKKDNAVYRAVQPIRAMAAHGDYGMNALSQRKYLEMMIPDMLKELHEGATIYDLGCADGVNSMLMISKLRRAFKNITVALVDLPDNDWETTRFMIENQVDYLAPNSGMFEAPHDSRGDRGALVRNNGRFGELVAGSFYRNLASPNSVDMFVASTSVHLLSDSMNKNPQLVAEDDWLNFLQNREKELVPGGTLFVSGMARRESADRGTPRYSYGAVYKVIEKTLKSAVANKVVPEAKRDTWFFPCYSRTPAEWHKPFENGFLPELKMEKFSLVAVQSPYWDLSKGESSVETSANFADYYVPSVVGWIGPYMAEQLGPEVVDHFKADLWEAVSNNPQDYMDDFLEAVMLIRKTSESAVPPLRSPPVGEIAHGAFTGPFAPGSPMGLSNGSPEPATDGLQDPIPHGSPEPTADVYQDRNPYSTAEPIADGLQDPIPHGSPEPPTDGLQDRNPYRSAEPTAAGLQDPNPYRSAKPTADGLQAPAIDTPLEP